MMPIAVCGEAALAEFRSNWTGQRTLDLLAAHDGRLRIDWAVGVGKSHNIDQVIAAAILQQRYDLVVALMPTRQVIEERAWVQAPPAHVRVVNLRPRPATLCGEAFNKLWQQFERQGMGSLGRARLCQRCPHAGYCQWPGQFGKRLAGTQVLFAAQAHLVRAPGFVTQCANWAGANRVLTILDEVHFLMASQERQIVRIDLVRFLAVLDGHEDFLGQPVHQRWRYLCNLLLTASNDDLRGGDWHFPVTYPDWNLAIQSKGWLQFGDAFRFIAHTLSLFAQSLPESRERLTDGTLRFAVPSDLAGDFIVYSAQTPHALTEHRLGQSYPSPFSTYRFGHPDTVWHNLASRLGMQCYFGKNAPQIIDVFAQLILRRWRQGRRVLCIAKKRLIPFCASQLSARLSELSQLDFKILEQPAPDVDLSQPFHLPIIGYGAIGTNRFEHFDCVYCLTGFYVTERILSSALQDLRASDFQVPLVIRTVTQPARRIAEPAASAHAIYDVARLAQASLDHLEMGTVLQAIGRVRPFTRPREVITFQCADHPTDAYTNEFGNLAQMRRHFGLIDRRAAKGSATAKQVRALQLEGLAQKVVAQRLNVGLRTVQRYWLPESTTDLNNHLPLKESCRVTEVAI